MFKSEDLLIERATTTMGVGRGGRERALPGFSYMVFFGLFLLFFQSFFAIFRSFPPGRGLIVLFFGLLLLFFGLLLLFFGLLSVAPLPGNFSADALDYNYLNFL